MLAGVVDVRRDSRASKVRLGLVSEARRSIVADRRVFFLLFLFISALLAAVSTWSSRVLLRVDEALQSEIQAGAGILVVKDPVGQLESNDCMSFDGSQFTVGGVINLGVFWAHRAPGLPFEVVGFVGQTVSIISGFQRHSRSVGVAAGFDLAAELGLREGSSIELSNGEYLTVDLVIPRSDRTAQFDRTLLVARPALSLIDQCIIDPATILPSRAAVGVALSRFAGRSPNSFAVALVGNGSDHTSAESLGTDTGSLGTAVELGVLIGLLLVGLSASRRAERALWILVGWSGPSVSVIVSLRGLMIILTAAPAAAGLSAASLLNESSFKLARRSLVLERAVWEILLITFVAAFVTIAGGLMRSRHVLRDLKDA